MGQGVLRVWGIVVCFWAKLGMTAPSEWKCVFKIKRQFCFLFNLLPESWVQFFIFPGQLAQIMRKKNKIFLILDGEDLDFTIKAFSKFYFIFYFLSLTGCCFLQLTHYYFLNHISCDLTLNCNFVLKSSLTAMGIFVSSHLIFQVKAFLLLIIHFSRLFLAEMTVNLALWLLFCFLTSYWWNLLYLRWCNWFGLFISSENSQA